MDWYGRRRKIVLSHTSPDLASSPTGLAVRFERLEIVWMHVSHSRVNPI
jgi:hypothetical protein